jgi:hypothetical protein
MNNIPKICHLMWDSSPMAYLQILTVISFHRLNPDWKIIVYVPIQTYKELGANTYVPDYTGKDYFPMLAQLDYVEIRSVDLRDYDINTALHFILCSDQLRMHILYRDGGLYTDFDVIWVRPMSHLPETNCLGERHNPEASICYHKDTHEWSNIAVLMAEPGSAYIKELVEEQKRVKPPYVHQIYGTDLIDRLYPHYSKAVAKYPRMMGVRYKTFYPYDVNNLRVLYVSDHPELIEDPNVLCVHWFNGHAMSKKYINNEEYNRPCSMTSILNNLKLNKGQI